MTSAGNVAGSQKTSWTAVDSQNIVSAAEADNYNYGAAGGYSLDRVWIRVLARVMFGG